MFRPTLANIGGRIDPLSHPGGRQEKHHNVSVQLQNSVRLRHPMALRMGHCSPGAPAKSARLRWDAGTMNFSRNCATVPTSPSSRRLWPKRPNDFSFSTLTSWNFWIYFFYYFVDIILITSMWNFREIAQLQNVILFWPALLGRLLWSFWFWIVSLEIVTMKTLAKYRCYFC